MMIAIRVGPFEVDWAEYAFDQGGVKGKERTWQKIICDTMKGASVP
jgi:hypothetical protein